MGAHRRRRRPRRGGEGAGLSERREQGIPASSERSPRVEQCGPAVQPPRAGSLSPRVCRVQPDVPAVRRAFDYTLPDTLTDAVRVGTIVRVPLHGRRVRGWVLDADVTAEVEDARLRAVHAVVSAGPPPDVVDLCTWAAWRWAGPLATFLRAASPPNVVAAGPEPEQETAVYPPAADAPSAPLVVVAPDGDDAALVARVIAPEGSTVVVDPDVARSARVVTLLEQRGREVVSLRSDREAAELSTAWDRARSGACVVVGGRTAIWAPVPDLARVVMVDEADEALEDERAPTWNGRDVAFERVRRARAAIRVVTPAPTVDALVALGDPTPATERVQWPRVTVVDTRDEPPGQALLSSVLADELRRLRDAGRRSVCVLNRRGRARLLACRTCGELARCERCGATVGEREGALACPRCALTRPAVCLHCHGTRFRAVRPGVHRVRDDLAALLPRASVAAVDASTLALPDDDVLIGTEAVLHRAPRDGTVGLVAFLELDQELLAPRAARGRAGAVAARAGRAGARSAQQSGAPAAADPPAGARSRGGCPRRRAAGRGRGRTRPAARARLAAVRGSGGADGRVGRGRGGVRRAPRCRRRHGAGTGRRGNTRARAGRVGARAVRRARAPCRRRRPRRRAAPGRRRPSARVASAAVRLGRVILFAKDVRRLGAFYQDVLGLSVIATDHDPDEWLLLDTGGAELALHRVPDPWNAGLEITDPPQPRHGSPHKAVFVVDDVVATREQLLARCRCARHWPREPTRSPRALRLRRRRGQRLPGLRSDRVKSAR